MNWMGRKIFAILLLCIPVMCFSQTRWDFRQVSMSYWRVIQYENQQAQTIDLLWDRALRSHRDFPVYYGAGVHFTASLVYTEFGLRGLYNLISASFGLSPNFRIFPYITGSYNIKDYISEDNPRTVYQPRLGIGISGKTLKGKAVLLHTQIQFLYDLNQPSLTFSQHLTAEIKVGVGVMLKRK